MGVRVSPELLTGTRFPIRIYLHRILMEKQADWLMCQGEGKIVKACSRFDACISSLLIKPELHSKIGSYQLESTFFGSGYYLKNILLYL